MVKWKTLSLFLYQIYWTQIALPVNYLIYHIRFNLIHIERRSTKILITSRQKTIDTIGEMKRLEEGRDNMVEFVRTVPDECLPEMSFRWFCGSKRI